MLGVCAVAGVGNCVGGRVVIGGVRSGWLDLRGL